MDEDFLTWLLSEIKDCSNKIRIIEDIAKKHSVDHSADRAYIACVAYRNALNDVLAKQRSLDDGKNRRAIL